MKTLRYLAAAVVAAGFMAAPANAALFVFKGDGLNATPTGNSVACASAGDLCTVDHTLGFDYLVDGVALNVKAYEDWAGYDDTTPGSGVATRLIQDINPSDSGLGAWSESNGSDDQTQFDAMEAIRFTFTEQQTVTNVEFNAGGDTNCSSFGSEGPCGDFRLYIDGIFIATITAIDNIGLLGTGTDFLLIAVTQGAGFTIATMEVSDVPVPAALPLLLSGLAGLGFASRRRKTA